MDFKKVTFNETLDLSQLKDFLKSQGLTIVPIEPTEAMMKAGFGNIDPDKVFKRMIAAYEEQQ